MRTPPAQQGCEDVCVRLSFLRFHCIFMQVSMHPNIQWLIRQLTRNRQCPKICNLAWPWIQPTGITLPKTARCLANDRTLLAFLRTALMLFATGVTFIMFFDDDILTLGLGWAFVALTPALLAFGVFRHRQVIRHLCRNYPHLEKDKCL